jgi:hypothetical protein
VRADAHAWPGSEAPPNGAYGGAEKANGEAKDSRTLYIEQLRAEAAGARAQCAAAAQARSPLSCARRCTDVARCCHCGDDV